MSRTPPQGNRLVEHIEFQNIGFEMQSSILPQPAIRFVFLREGSWKFNTWSQLSQFLDFRILSISRKCSKKIELVGQCVFLREGSWKFITWGRLVQFLDFRKICLSPRDAHSYPIRLAGAFSLGRGLGNLVPGANWFNFWTLGKFVYLHEMPTDDPIGSQRRFP